MVLLQEDILHIVEIIETKQFSVVFEGETTINSFFSSFQTLESYMAAFQIFTLWECIDRSIDTGVKSISPSSGLKNCPTAMEVAGGGLPEIV